MFEGSHLDYLKDTFEGVLDSFEVELLEFNGEEDHVHLLVSYPPKHSIIRTDKQLKGGFQPEAKHAIPGAGKVLVDLKIEKLALVAELLRL